MRLLRGAFHPRTGAQPHQRKRHGGSPRLADAGYHRDPVAGAKRQQLPRSLAGGLGFRHASGARRRDSRHPPRPLHHLASARFRQGHRRRHGRQPGALQSRASAGAVGLLASAGGDGPALYARRIHAAHRMDEGARGASTRSPPISLSDSPERRSAISKRRSICSTKCSTIRFSASNIRRAPTPRR